MTILYYNIFWSYDIILLDKLVEKLELTNKHTELIKKALIKSKLYPTTSLELNELVQLVAKKSALFLSTLQDDVLIQKFLDKTAENILSKHQKEKAEPETQILQIALPEKEASNDVFQLDDVLDLEEEPKKEQEIELYTEEKIVFDVSCEELPTLNPEKLYEHIEDPKVTNKTKTVPADVANKILDILTEASTVPDTKDYIKIFYLKYIKKLKQAQIAKKLHISEIELSQKYFEMVKYVKEKLYSKPWWRSIRS